jgi:NDP-sugar pyrophosphorylase family protein
MQAVILAGGIGTRMRPLTYIMPKVMLPIGGKPMLEHTINYLKNYGFSEFIVCVAYLKTRIMDYFKGGENLGVDIQFAEADMPLGTAGQLKTAEKTISGRFLAMNGDIITSLNIRKLIEYHEERRGVGTIALKKFEIAVPYGHIEVDNTYRITKFEEKPKLSILANAGIYIFEPRLFDYIPADQTASLERETFPAMLSKGETFKGYYEEAYWADVGTMTDFERVDKELLSKYYQKTA